MQCLGPQGQKARPGKIIGIEMAGGRTASVEFLFLFGFGYAFLSPRIHGFPSLKTSYYMRLRALAGYGSARATH